MVLFRYSNSSDDGPASSQAHRRYLEKLQSRLVQTQRHFDTFNKQIDAHWSDHIQQQRENDRFVHQMLCMPSYNL